MIKKILEISFLTLTFIWAKLWAGDDLKTELYGVVIGGVTILCIELLVFLIEKRAFIRLYLNSFNPFREKKIRLTLAYLYKIEEKGKYLLVKSRHISNTYQPVGGVYKYYNPEAKKELACMGAIPDDNIDCDDISECDLRLKLLNRNKLGTFLQWFLKGERREIDPWREFYEELVATQILPVKEFSYIHYELVGQHFEPIHYDEHFGVDTFKYADIFIPKFVTHRQIEEIKKLYSIGSNEYIWVTQEEIMHGKNKNGQLIANHTYKIFHTKFLN
jgi:hypothetical protein